jgi:hypothetical protein
MQGLRCHTSWGALLLLAGVVTASPPAHAGACADSQLALQLAQISNASDWQEFDAPGRRLVHESGMLGGQALSGELRCGDWWYLAEVSQTDGTRGYDGQTSSGVPALSQSALRQSAGLLQTSVQVSDGWRLGLRLSGQTTWRDIASVGAASGYPERFDWTLASIGAQWCTALGPGQLALAAWVAMPLSSSMLLSLPGRDTLTLKLGALQQSELALGWRMPLGTDWHVQADARYVGTTIGQGDDAVITRGGVPVGIAHQPRTSVVDSSLTLRLGYQF